MNDDYPPAAYYVTPAEALEQWTESLQKQNAALKAELREAVKIILTGSSYYCTEESDQFLDKHADIVKESTDAN